MQSDRDLLARARVGEVQAVEDIHAMYYQSIFRYIAFRVRYQDVAEDLTSEVFVRFLQAIHARNAPHTTVRGWLFAVASHLVSDFYRQNAHMSPVELDETLASNATAPEELVGLRLTNAELHQALLTLTEDQQQVIALRFGQELPFREIACLLGKSEDAVKKLQARALLTLARQMPAGAMD